MTDRDGLKVFEAWLKVYWANEAAPFLDVDDLREAWVQGVAWGKGWTQAAYEDGQLNMESRCQAEIVRLRGVMRTMEAEIDRMMAVLIDIRLHVKQAGGNAKLRPRFLMDAVNRGLGREGGE